MDDLLEFSRLSRAPLDVQRFDLSDLVAEARCAVMVEARDREIDWFVGPLPAVIGDRSLLFQATVNLLSNAVKYTRGRSPGAIEVGHYRETTSGEAVVYVRDNGAGFDMQYAGKLFGVFQRLHGSDEFEGTGVGLANVRRIVSRHGGRTWAEGVSTPARPSTSRCPSRSSLRRSDRHGVATRKRETLSRNSSATNRADDP